MLARILQGFKNLQRPLLLSNCCFFNMESRDEQSQLVKLKYQSKGDAKQKVQQAIDAKDEQSRLIKLRYEKKAQHADEDQSGASGPSFQIKPPKGTRDLYPEQMAVRRKVIDTISSIFRKHGAVEIDTPVFELKQVLTGKYGEDSKLIYDLEDQGGQKCSLRYDLTVPFARFMANNTNIKKIKRFHIGKVYRRDQPIMTKGRFRQFYQCDLDIAGKYDPMIPDAEVISVMQEILEALDIKDFIVKVNHRKILEAMIQVAGAQHDKFKTICSSIDKLDKEPWEKVKEELVGQKGVSEATANKLGELVTYKGDPNKILLQLKNSKVLGEKAQETLQEMELLFSFLAAFGRLSKVSFDLSLARGLDYYTGVIYQIVLVDKKYEIGSISGGGRYDELIGMFSGQQIPSVGGSIGIERLFNIIEQKYKNKVKTNECQVLVAAAGPLKVEQKLKILGRLWNAGIKAQTMYSKIGSGKKQIDHAFQHDIPMILWVGQEELKTGQVKLKVLYKNIELLIPLQNLQKEVLAHAQQFQQDFEKGLVKLDKPEAPKVPSKTQ